MSITSAISIPRASNGHERRNHHRLGSTMAVSLLLALLIAVANAVEVPEDVLNTAADQSAPGSAKEASNEVEEFGAVKSKRNPRRSPQDWTKYGFAFADRREAEFEALRVDEMDSPDSLLRVKAKDLDGETYKNVLEPKRVPFIIEDLPVFDNWEASKWTIPMLGEKYPTMKVKVGEDEDEESILMSMAEFARYTKIQKDDVPLYVFDPEVYDDEVGKDVMKQYTVPKMFDDDLLELGEGEGDYPSYRWLLLGPKRSGSGCHFDPLGSSAWNTLISGRKLWFLAPPHMDDIVNENTSRCVARWFIEDVPRLRATHGDQITMFVQHPGETIVVPAYWMHAVLNIDDAVAVTQNFVSSFLLEDAWEPIKEHSGTFARKILQGLMENRQDLATLALKIDEASREHRDDMARHEGEEEEDEDGEEEEDDDDDF